MPALVRLYIRQTLIGFAVSAVFVSLLFWFNVANLWHLVTAAPGGWLAGFLLFMFNGIVFSGVQFGISIMRMAEADDDDPFGGKRIADRLTPAERPIAIPVRAETGARRA